jgi:hypothetical protein
MKVSKTREMDAVFRSRPTIPSIVRVTCEPFVIGKSAFPNFPRATGIKYTLL